VLVEETESLCCHSAFIACAAQGYLHIEEIGFDVVLLNVLQRHLGKILGQETDLALIACHRAGRVVSDGHGAVKLLEYGYGLVMNFFS